MREPIHFKSQDERLAFLRGGFEEIIPQKVCETAQKEHFDAEIAEKSQKKVSKSTKSKPKAKKGAKKDEISAE